MAGPSRRSTYDRYIPAQDDITYRSGYGDSYRPDGDSYRPLAGDSYRPDSWRPYRAPMGDHYEPSGNTDTWSSYHKGYGKRREWAPERRDIMAERMFEPSDSWKSSHA